MIHLLSASFRCVGRLLLALACFQSGLVAAESTAQVFAHETSDLTPDRSVRFGKLPNGMRYAIRANAEPKGRAALRLIILAGSCMESERQRGIAHFLEHMSFNGSTHYPPGTLIEYFQRLGMDFGGDTNAYTGLDQTVYMIDLPDTKSTTVAEGLKVIGDYAGGLLLDAKEIDKERGIILAEKRTRDSVQYRTFVAQWDFTLRGTLLPERLPIGTEKVITEATRDDFKDFYDTWYRPERMVFVAVGDFDAEAVEKQTTAALGSIPARAPARSDPDLGPLPSKEGIQVAFHAEAEAPQTRIEISTITPDPREPDTKATRLRYLPRDLAVSIMNQRLSILAKKEGAPFSSARVSVGSAFNYLRESSMEIVCKPEQWEAALAVAEQELRRALEHGFQAAELSEATAHFSNALEQAVKTAPTRRSPQLAMELVSSFVENDVFTDPETERALLQPALEKITLDACLSGFREAWRASHRYVFLTGNVRIEGDAKKAMLAAYEKSAAVRVGPPQKLESLSFAYTDFGPSGKVSSKKTVDDLGITLVEFENGVRLNLKRTDFEANRIALSMRIGYGQLAQSQEQAGLATFVSNTFKAGGLGKHSADDLRRMLAGKNVSGAFRVANDAIVASAATTPTDLLLQLQLLAAYVIDPGYRPEAVRQFHKSVDQYYISLAHTPSGPLQAEVPRLLANGDTRFGIPPKEQMLALDSEKARAWLAPQLSKGALEIALVGDLNPDEAIAAVARTFGALPKREMRPAFVKQRQVKFPEAPLDREFRVETKIPKAEVALYWPSTDANDVRHTRRMNMLAQILEDRLRVKVREELGDAYSPGAGSVPSDTYLGYGYFIARITADPAQVKKLTQVVIDIADDLARKGMSQDELDRAKLPMLTRLRESARTNAYWLEAVLAKAQEKPVVLDWCRNRLADTESIRVEEIAELAKRYLPASRATKIAVYPEGN